MSSEAWSSGLREHLRPAKSVKVVVERCRKVWRSHLQSFPSWRSAGLCVRHRSLLPSGGRAARTQDHHRAPPRSRPGVGQSPGSHPPARGFQTLRRVRIRHLRQSYAWYGRISQYRVVGWLSRHQKVIRKIFRLRLYILPDPFSWLFYLSRHLTILTFTRYLLVDIYLFVGVLAVEPMAGSGETPNSSPNRGNSSKASRS